MNLEIRKAEPKDVSRVAEIAQVLYLDIPGFEWHKENFIEKQIEKGEYFIAEEDERAFGILSLRERRGMLYIETLAVAKDVQSKGIGSSLLDFAKQFAKDNDFKILRTTSFYEYGVKDFWVKQGFRLLDEPGEYGGHKFYRFEMEL